MENRVQGWRRIGRSVRPHGHLIFSLLVAALLSSCGTSPTVGGPGFDDFTDVDPPSEPPRQVQPIGSGLGPHNNVPTPDDWKDRLASGDYSGLVDETTPVIGLTESDPFFVTAMVYRAAAQLSQSGADLDRIQSDLDSIEGFVRSDLWRTQPDVLSILLVEQMTVLARSDQIEIARVYCRDAIKLFPTYETLVQDLYQQESGRGNC